MTPLFEKDHFTRSRAKYFWMDCDRLVWKYANLIHKNRNVEWRISIGLAKSKTRRLRYGKCCSYSGKMSQKDLRATVRKEMKRLLKNRKNSEYCYSM